MSVDPDTSVIEEERRMARTTAISLGMWLALTIAAVILLLVFGDPLANLLV